jgi:hypothetical protein
MKAYNLNHYMYIQINEKGWEHLRQTVGQDYIKHRILSYAKEIDGKKWYRLQCHSVFSLFPITYGHQSLINTNVMFDDDAFTELKQETK